MNIDVEIDVADAGLRSPVRAALVPGAIARAGAGDIGELQASPLRQRSAALTAKLPGQHGFLTDLVAAEDVRVELAIAPLVRCRLPAARRGLPCGRACRCGWASRTLADFPR